VDGFLTTPQMPAILKQLLSRSGTRSAAGGTRRKNAGVRAAGLRGAACQCRRGAGADRPAGSPVGDRATPPLAADLPPSVAEWVAAQFDTVAVAAEECDSPVATGVMPTGVWQ
jgi:hypothetical protein